MDDMLPPFDPRANCIKCGWSIPDPVAPEPKVTKGPGGEPTTLPAGPPPPPQPPTVAYCNGLDCPYAEAGEQVDEHMHQFCDTCGFEWLSAPMG